MIVELKVALVGEDAFLSVFKLKRGSNVVCQLLLKMALVSLCFF